MCRRASQLRGTTLQQGRGTSPEGNSPAGCIASLASHHRRTVVPVPVRQRCDRPRDITDRRPSHVAYLKIPRNTGASSHGVQVPPPISHRAKPPEALQCAHSRDILNDTNFRKCLRESRRVKRGIFRGNLNGFCGTRMPQVQIPSCRLLR
jgi:hypothetical protein